MHPNSNQTQSPANESTAPRSQRRRAAPTEPTEDVMLDGVEKMPVPIIRPMLYECVRTIHLRENEELRDGIHQQCCTK
jgi:hypothetical protein